MWRTGSAQLEATIVPTPHANNAPVPLQSDTPAPNKPGLAPTPRHELTRVEFDTQLAFHHFCRHIAGTTSFHGAPQAVYQFFPDESW